MIIPGMPGWLGSVQLSHKFRLNHYNSDPSGMAYDRSSMQPITQHLYVGDRTREGIYQYSVGGHYERSIRTPNPSGSLSPRPILHAVTRMVEWIAVAWAQIEDRGSSYSPASERYMHNHWIQFYSLDVDGNIQTPPVTTQEIQGVARGAANHDPYTDAMCGEILEGNNYFLMLEQHPGALQMRLFQFDWQTASRPRLYRPLHADNVLRAAYPAGIVLGMAKAPPAHPKRVMYMTAGLCRWFDISGSLSTGGGARAVSVTDRAVVPNTTYAHSLYPICRGMAADYHNTYYTVSSDGLIRSFIFSP